MSNENNKCRLIKNTITKVLTKNNNIRDYLHYNSNLFKYIPKRTKTYEKLKEQYVIYLNIVKFHKK